MDKWKGRVCLVTGASVGIGAALVRALVKEGMRVAGCARRKDRLEALRDSLDEADRGSFLPLACDLTQEDQIKSLFASIVETWGGVDVLINNGMYVCMPLPFLLLFLFVLACCVLCCVCVVLVCCV